MEPEEIDGTCMGVVHGENLFEKAKPIGLFAQPESRLPLKEASSNRLTAREIFLEEEHGR
jgi:hypothetical protein